MPNETEIFTQEQMKVLHSWILNHKGLLVYSEVPANEIKIFVRNSSVSWDQVLLDIYARTSNDMTPNNEPVLLILEDYEFQPRSKIYISRYDDDLYIFAMREVTEFSGLFDHYQKLKDNRAHLKEKYKGLLFCEFKDRTGPVPLFNNSPLNDEIAVDLSIQGLAQVSLGQSTVPEKLVGPVPITNSSLYTLIYSFKYQDKTSIDPRIKQGGRIATIFIIFSEEKLDKIVLEFLEAYLKQWTLSPTITSGGLQNLSVGIRQTVILAWDSLIIQKKQTDYLQSLVTRLNSEIFMLKEKLMKLKYENTKLKEKLELKEVQP